MDEPISPKSRGEVQSNTKFLELDCDWCESSCASTLHNWGGKFAACEKARFFARRGQQVRFCQNLKEILRFERLDRCRKINIRAEDEQVEDASHRKRGTLA